MIHPAARLTHPVQQKALLVAHAAQIRTHVDQLSKKSYWEQFENAPDFVVLFMPNDAFYAGGAKPIEDPEQIEVVPRNLVATDWIESVQLVEAPPVPKSLDLPA